jgi:hypothetical protein
LRLRLGTPNDYQLQRRGVLYTGQWNFTPSTPASYPRGHGFFA